MSDKLRWGILGCTGIARRAVIPAFEEVRGAVLHGIASREPKRAAEWAAEFGIPKSYGSYQDLCDDPDIGAVYIPLPNNLHRPWAGRAAKAGKHILCEKPMAMTAPEVRGMMRDAERAGVKLMEAFMYRFHPQIERLRTLLDARAIGRVRTVRSTFAFVYSGDWRNYRWHPEMGGGALYDIGCYTISAARLVFGAEPLSVRAAAKLHPKRRVDVATHLLVEFPGERFAHLDCSFESEFQSRLEAAGSEGLITLERAFSAKLNEVELTLVRDGKVRRYPFPATNQYARMIEHFGRAAVHDQPLRYPPEDARRNMRVIDAAFASLKSGKAVRLRPLR